MYCLDRKYVKKIERDSLYYKAVIYDEVEDGKVHHKYAIYKITKPSNFLDDIKRISFLTYGECTHSRDRIEAIYHEIDSFIERDKKELNDFELSKKEFAAWADYSEANNE